MKRILLYIVILAALLPLPLQRADVGKLRPIQAVSVIVSEEGVLLCTDSKDVGFGKTALAALENLRATTPGIVYLDTAEFLLISADAAPAVAELRNVLRDTVKICVAEGEIAPWEVTGFLSTHDNLPKLKDWESTHLLPVLKTQKDRYILTSE